MNRKYANDYKACEDVSGLGRKKKKYVYTGPYYAYTFQTSRKRMAAEYLVLTILTAAVWIAAGLLNNAGSRFGLTVIPYAVGFIPIFYLVCGVFSTCFASGEKQERYQYDMSYRRIGRSINGLLVTAGIAAAGDIIFTLLHFKKIDIGLEVLFLICVIAAGTLAVLIKKVYSKNPCLKINTTE